jgi:copper transport protein
MTGVRWRCCRHAVSAASAPRPAGLIALWLLALLVLLPGGAAPVFAHAALVQAEPADGAVLATPPARLLLTFNEPVVPLVLRLVGPDETSISLAGGVDAGSAVAVGLPGMLAPGSYRVHWRVISADGHPAGGSVLLSVGAPSASPPPAAEPPDQLLRAAIWLAKLALYAGLFAGVGGATFLAVMAPASRRGRQFVAGACCVGLVGAPLSIGLQGLDALELPLSALTWGIAWKTGASTTFGMSAAIAIAALGAGLLASLMPAGLAKPVSLLAVFGCGVALAASGHAGTADPQWLMRPAIMVHAVAVAFWLGSLVPLGLSVAASSPDRDGGAVLLRFSRTIPGVLVLLVATGLLLAVVQVPQPAALFETAYGRVLLAKLTLFVAVAALAARNRWQLTARAAHGEAAARRALKRAIVAETVLVAAILGAVALWRFTPPPRAVAAAAAAPAQLHIHTEQAMADLAITPGRAGPVTASIMIMTGDFGPLDARAVSLVLSNPAAGLGPIARQAQKPGDGTWRIDALAVPAPGRWEVRIEIVVSDRERITLADAIDIRR